MKYKFLEHKGDIKFRSFGKCIEEAFENAAYALQEAITEGIKIKKKIKWKIDAGGKDNEALLYNFLEEFLFLLDAQDFLLAKIEKINIKNSELDAEVWGDKASDYKFSNSVKAITYNQIFVKQEKGKWICQIVVDV